MTENTTEKRSWGNVTLSFDSIEGLSFGPANFTRELYDVNPTAGQVAKARTDSVIEGVFKAGGKLIKTVATRGANARLFSYLGLDRLYPTTDTGVDTGYTVGTTLEPYIKSKPAKQKWLQYVTDKIGKYVYGASVEKGEDEGTYIDETLAERAGRYLKNYWEGAKEKARKYAADFIEAVVTDGHEYDGHYRAGIKDEANAEKAGVRRLKNYLEKKDPVVTFAVNSTRRAA